MSKRKRSPSIDKKYKEGRGQGLGVDYKPWVTIQDVPSLGRVTRLKGIKIPCCFPVLIIFGTKLLIFVGIFRFGN